MRKEDPESFNERKEAYLLKTKPKQDSTRHPTRVQDEGIHPPTCYTAA